MLRGTMVNLDGKLALEYVDGPHRERPVIVKTYWVFTHQPAIQYGEPHETIGREATWTGNGNRWNVYMGNGSYRVVDHTDCPTERREFPVEKPKDGRTYTWEWSGHGHYPLYSPGWEKVEFPLCHECNKVHNPAFVSCPICGKCHLPGTKCKLVDCFNCGRRFPPDEVSTCYCRSCRQLVYNRPSR